MPNLTKAQLARMPKRVRDAVEAAERPKTKPSVPTRRAPQTEHRYAQFLVAEMAAGTISAFESQPEPLVLGRDCTYTPDFQVLRPDGKIEYHEIKGKQVWEDSIIKWKWAGEKYRQYRFVWAQWKNDTWKMKIYRPLERVAE